MQDVECKTNGWKGFGALILSLSIRSLTAGGTPGPGDVNNRTKNEKKKPIISFSLICFFTC